MIQSGSRASHHSSLNPPCFRKSLSHLRPVDALKTDCRVGVQQLRRDPRERSVASNKGCLVQQLGPSGIGFLHLGLRRILTARQHLLRPLHELQLLGVPLLLLFQHHHRHVRSMVQLVLLCIGQFFFPFALLGPDPRAIVRTLAGRGEEGD
ncbi:unnamed protein product [Ectocarpus fasciculatus]